MARLLTEYEAKTQGTHLECSRWIERVADRLFEGEEAVLHARGSTDSELRTPQPERHRGRLVDPGSGDAQGVRRHSENQGYSDLLTVILKASTADCFPFSMRTSRRAFG